ncbi:MAG: protein translocase subunit SecF [Coriobacteriia bacterium]|nr:protein translocase subunit SecF [Coriobacteriia bacterium]MCL2749411.1 protein translocase subunit SecF [Coriobacteriia bacterium]
MVRPFKKDINFLKNRRIFFTISLILVVAAITVFIIRGPNLGIEFVGGTSINFTNTGAITTEEMRSAFTDAGSDPPIVQTTSSGAGEGDSGFVVRTSETDSVAASALADEVALALELESDSFQVMTIGPSYGLEIAKNSAIAFLIAIGLIIAFVAIRFEYKMGLVAILGLVHVMIIILGIYAATGREINPNVVAALLTIMGYSLYDTVVVFHRIKDNSDATNRHSFMTVANHSINQVLMRSINTTTTSLVPILAMLFFGGETLKDFAFAMAFGVVLGACTSLFISTPIYALWKQREAKHKKLYEKYGDGIGEFTVADNLGESR